MSILRQLLLRRSQAERTPVPNPSAADSETNRGRSRFFWPFVAISVAAIGTLYFQSAESAQAYYAQAKAVFEVNPAKAERLAQLAVEKSRGHFPAAQLLQCRALAATNRWNTALGAFSLIKSTDSCDPADLVALAEVALKSQELQLAGRALDAALKAEQPPDRAFELFVPMLLLRGQMAEALAVCRNWQKLYPENPQAWAYAGDLEVKRFELGTSISDFQNALKHNPAPELERHIRTVLVQLLADTGNITGARKELDLVLKSGPVENVVRLKSVQVLRMEGKQKEALHEIEDYIKNVEKSSEALKQRGILHLDLGDNPSAIRDLKEALAADPFDKVAHFKLAQAYIRSGKADLAQPHLESQRRLTEATTKILDVEGQLQGDPKNEALKKQLEELYKTIGRKQ
jgi:tetratricopeptide (TPR) repeat protein